MSTLRALRQLAAVAVASSAVLTGCRSSPPVRFYTLDATAAEHQSVAVPAAVQVAAVNIPPQLDRQEIVRESAPNTLQLSDRNRWGAPLAGMTRDVLTQDLIRRLPPGQVILPRATAPPGSFEVTVDVLKFGAGPAGVVIFDGGWSLFRLGSDVPLVNRHLNLTEAGALDYAAQVKAMSTLLGHLADDIVAGVSQATVKSPPKAGTG
ncbi:MAG TPA: PqiC family protein [Steroidobacteraceae bacterium]